MNELGNVNISQEVVATIAELVVSEIEGVSSLVGGKSKNEIIKNYKGNLDDVFLSFLEHKYYLSKNIGTLTG